MQPKNEFRELGWLPKERSARFMRLNFSPQSVPSNLSETQLAARACVLEDARTGLCKPETLPSLFQEEEDVVLSEKDRYGIPICTKLGLSSGLIRTDPYYSSDYLEHFYRKHYRLLYSQKETSFSRMLCDQIYRGSSALDYLKPFLTPKHTRVLDYGCGMGGQLFPFKHAGFDTFGCDYGEELINQGKKLGLNLLNGGLESITSQGAFDIIVLSHVIEHIPNIREFLIKLKTSTHRDSLIFISVPGVLNIHQAYKGNFLSYLQNAHVWHFTSSTLARLLEDCGYSVLYIDESINCVVRSNREAGVAQKDQQNTRNGLKVFQYLSNLESRFMLRHPQQLLKAILNYNQS